MPGISYFEKEFNKEIRDKKRTATGVHSKKGKRGYVGKLFTTVDLLTGIEKREYMKAGELKVTNVYKQLIPADELETYTPDSQKQILENWRENHTLQEILDGTGLNRNRYYALLADLEIIERPNWLSDDKESELQPTEHHDIMSLEDFKKLPLLERYKTITDYYKKYTAKEIGEVWGKKESGVYQMRYYIKNKIKKDGLSVEDDTKSEQMEAVAVNASSPSDDKLIRDDSNTDLSRYDDDTVNNVVSIAETIETSNTADIESVSSIKKELDYLKGHFNQHIESQNNMIIDLLKDIQDLKENQMESKKTDSIELERHSNTASVSSMSLTFQEEKEGFLMHPEILRFISVLKKNPDSFKINISLEKIDE